MNASKSQRYVRAELVAVLVALSLATGCDEESGLLGFDRTLADSLQVALDESVDQLQLPGAVMAVRDPDGDVWAGTSGWAMVGGAVLLDGSAVGGMGQIMSDDWYVRIGSLTKTFTATVVLQLVDEGTLSLDDTVEQVIQQWLPGTFDFVIPFADSITIRHLLAMRSGMGNYSSTTEFVQAIDDDPLAKWEPVTLIRYGVESEDTPAYPPDTAFEYNSGNYILLGIFIEQITGRTYAAEVSSRILEPLGLTHTSVPASPAMPYPYVHGYLYDPGQGALLDMSTATDPSWCWAAGSMISTVYDLLPWVRALLDGSLISPALQQERLALQAGEIPGVGSIEYGLGIYGDQGALGHGGDYAGFYSAYGARYAGHDVAIVVNGQLESAGEPAAIPARAILLEAAAVLDSIEAD